MNYNSETNSLEVSIKLFIDDIEDVLEQEKGMSLFVCSEKEVKEVDALIHEYIKQHFKLSENEASMQFDFVGKSCEQDYCYVFIEFRNFSVKANHMLENSLLTDDYHEQHNKVNYILDKEIKSFSFTKDKTKQAF